MISQGPFQARLFGSRLYSFPSQTTDRPQYKSGAIIFFTPKSRITIRLDTVSALSKTTVSPSKTISYGAGAPVAFPDMASAKSSMKAMMDVVFMLCVLWPNVQPRGADDGGKLAASRKTERA